METELVYHADSTLTTLESEVVAVERASDRTYVVLDRTIFYPESGGQLADVGTLGDARVIDVQLDAAGRALHAIEGTAPEVGARVVGSIDRARRRQHTALHTAQHLLSRALVDVAQADTVSSRLGESDCTVDVDRDRLADGAIAKAEALVNAIIDDDAPIRAYFPTPAELAALPLRRAPKVSERIRVVDIAGFDVSPCGGTHCTRTAQVGLLRVTGDERYKGKIRLHFSAGPRARAESSRERAILQALAAELTCGFDHVPGAVDSLRRELGTARDELKRLRANEVDRIAATWLVRATVSGEPIVELLDHGGRDLARALAKRLSIGAYLAVLVAPDGDGLAVVIARGPESRADAGALMKAAAAALDGRGGGKPETAEGRVAARPDALDTLRALARGAAT